MPQNSRKPQIETIVLNKPAYPGCQGGMACKTTSEKCALEDDLASVLESLKNAGTNGMFSRRFGHLPNLREILVKKDSNGKQINFLASADGYDIVRGMQRKNLIIPVVGDFGGEKTQAAVGAYLKKHGYAVTVFYASNVEIVLL